MKSVAATWALSHKSLGESLQDQDPDLVLVESSCLHYQGGNSASDFSDFRISPLSPLNPRPPTLDSPI